MILHKKIGIARKKKKTEMRTTWWRVAKAETVLWPSSIRLIKRPWIMLERLTERARLERIRMRTIVSTYPFQKPNKETQQKRCDILSKKKRDVTS